MILGPFKSQIHNFFMSWFQALWIWRQRWELALFPRHIWPALPKVGWSRWLEYMKRTIRTRVLGERGKDVDHAQASCSVVHYIFSVTACVSTHRACAFSLNNSPWKAHLANVAMNVCVWCVTRLCVKSYGCVLAPPSLPHPPAQQGKAEGLHLVGLIFRSFRQAFWEA